MHFPESYPVLDARIESFFPENLTASINLGANGTVSLTFPLLNPGDNIRFVVLIADSSPIHFQADARVVGLSKMKVTTQPEEPAKAGRRISWVVYPVGLFSVFLLVVALVGILSQFPKERRFKKMVRENQFQIPEGLLPDAAKQYVSSQLSWATDSDRKHPLNFLDSLPAGSVLAPEERGRLEQLMRESAAAATSNLTIGIVVVLISLIGCGYVLAQVL